MIFRHPKKNYYVRTKAGKTMSLASFCYEYGLGYSTVRTRFTEFYRDQETKSIFVEESCPLLWDGKAKGK